jgi:hypothetical protein
VPLYLNKGVKASFDSVEIIVLVSLFILNSLGDRKKKKSRFQSEKRDF